MLCLATFASDSARIEKPAAVDAEQYADFIENEVFNIQDLAEGAEIQRRRFNRMTPPGFSWVQPMFPSVVPFDADNFDEKFLDELLGEDKNSVAIYPLSLTQDPKTRETLVFNAEGKQIATIPADRLSREWPEDADPVRVTLLLDLLPAEDVEPYLYTVSRIEESLSQREIYSRVMPGRAIARSLGAGEFGICGIRKTTNGTMLITVTNGLDAAEVYAYTVAHTSSVVVATWTNEYDEVITSTNVIWHPVSPPFDGIESGWASRATNLVLTGGTGVWEDTNISSNDRVRFYAAAKRGDQDGDGLSDGAEILLHRTDQQSLDTDGDGLLDGYDISVQMGDPRYSLWANQGILYSESTGMRLFRGELSAGSSPLDDDTDGDGLPDGWEVQNDLDPLDAEGDNGPEGDPDGDGFDNALERELGAPANNAAWNGNELAYRLMHATPVVVTNTRSITTNLIGMRVTVEDSRDCVTGGNPGRQNEVATLEVRDLLECGYYVDIEIEGSVEDVDDGYDMVYFEAHSNNFYFSSHDGIPDGLKEECVMIDENAEKNNLILANSTVVLRYNTVGYRWHSGAYAEIIHATNTGPYKVVVSGADVICVGETAQMEASGAAGAPFTWSGNGDISVSTNGEVTGLAPGIATVIATDAGGCSGEKEIIILKVDLDIDANYDGSIDDADDYSEESPGGLVVHSDSWDDRPLTKIIIQKVQPEDLDCSVDLSISAGISKIELFEDFFGTQQISFFPVTYQNSDLPKTLWVRSWDTSDALGDIEFQLQLNTIAECQDIVRGTSIEVEYTNTVNQKYGFDGETDLPIYWKSIKWSDSDTAFAKMDPIAASTRVKFSSSSPDISVSPSSASTSPETLTLTSLGTMDSSIGADLGAIDYLRAAFLNVKNYSLIEKRVALYRVVEGVSNIPPVDATSAATIQAYLNDSVYNQCVAEFEVVDFGMTNVNYDLNNDGKLEYSSPLSSEAQVICSAIPLPANFDYVVYHVHDIAGANGFANRNNTYAFVRDGSLSIRNLIAHELGHAFGNLPDGGPSHWLMNNTGNCDEGKMFLPKAHWDLIDSRHR